MKLSEVNLLVVLIWLANAAKAASPGNAPPLPITGARVVHVTTEAQLQTAMGNLQSGDTILLADGTYNLTSTLYVNGRNNVTIRGAAGSTNVILAGKGMDNTNYGSVRFGIWSNGTNTTIAHLTIRETTPLPSRTPSSTWTAPWPTGWTTPHLISTMPGASFATILSASPPV